MNWLVLNQLIVLYLFNINLESVESIIVVDNLKFPSLHTATLHTATLHTGTIAPPPSLVLPNPTTLGILTNTHKPYRTGGIGSINIADDAVIYGQESNPISLQLPPLHREQYKKIGNDETYIEEQLNKYEAQHNGKLSGDDNKSEHKSSKNEGQHFHVTAKGAKGDSTKENHKKHYVDKGAKEHEDYDEDSKSDQHHNHHGGARKSKFNKKNSDNKSRTEKGFHSKYHKNEHHKLDDFFKNYHENGDFVKYGKKNSKINKVYKNLKKGGHKSRKGSESKMQKKGPKVIKLTII